MQRRDSPVIDKLPRLDGCILVSQPAVRVVLVLKGSFATCRSDGARSSLGEERTKIDLEDGLDEHFFEAGGAGRKLSVQDGDGEVTSGLSGPRFRDVCEGYEGKQHGVVEFDVGVVAVKEVEDFEAVESGCAATACNLIIVGGFFVIVIIVVVMFAWLRRAGSDSGGNIDTETVYRSLIFTKFFCAALETSEDGQKDRTGVLAQVNMVSTSASREKVAGDAAAWNR